MFSCRGSTIYYSSQQAELLWIFFLKSRHSLEKGRKECSETSSYLGRQTQKVAAARAAFRMCSAWWGWKSHAAFLRPKMWRGLNFQRTNIWKVSNDHSTLNFLRNTILIISYLYLCADKQLKYNNEDLMLRQSKNSNFRVSFQSLRLLKFRWIYRKISVKSYWVLHKRHQPLFFSPIRILLLLNGYGERFMLYGRW